MATTRFEDRSDPRNLRTLFDRATSLAQEHQVASVFVGIAGRESDTLVGDFIDFVEAELRVEDSVFRLLRERAVLLMTDIDLEAATAVMERVRTNFASRFPTMKELTISISYEALAAGGSASIKDVLPGLFDAAPRGRA